MHIIPFFTFEGFFLGPVYIYTWGLTAAIGVLMAVWLASKKTYNLRLTTNNSRVVSRPACATLRTGKQSSVVSQISESTFWNLVIILVLSIFIGARVAYILETWSYYSADPLAALRLWEGGFSFFGGAIGGILAGYIWSKKNKIDFLTLGWVFTPAWLFGLFFGRIGCFLIHDHLGKPTDLPWGVFIRGAYRHEPALYEAVWVLMVGIGLYLLEKYRKQGVIPAKAGIQKNPNNLLDSRLRGNDNKILKFMHLKGFFSLSLFLYSFGRFFLDFLRVDDPLYLGLTLAQWACILLIIWAIFSIRKLKPPPLSNFLRGDWGPQYNLDRANFSGVWLPR